MFSRVVAQFDHKPGSSAGNPLQLPRWFWPNGFSPAEHCTEMLLTNPETGNEINGEATSKKTGRSGRGTVVLVDEMAFIDEARHVFGTLRQTAGARIGLSSESIEVSTVPPSGSVSTPAPTTSAASTGSRATPRAGASD
jgi:hypothetical protein